VPPAGELLKKDGQMFESVGARQVLSRAGRASGESC